VVVLGDILFRGDDEEDGSKFLSVGFERDDRRLVVEVERPFWETGDEGWLSSSLLLLFENREVLLLRLLSLEEEDDDSLGEREDIILSSLLLFEDCDFFVLLLRLLAEIEVEVDDKYVEGGGGFGVGVYEVGRALKGDNAGSANPSRGILLLLLVEVLERDVDVDRFAFDDDDESLLLIFDDSTNSKLLFDERDELFVDLDFLVLEEEEDSGISEVLSSLRFPKKGNILVEEKNMKLTKVKVFFYEYCKIKYKIYKLNGPNMYRRITSNN